MPRIHMSRIGSILQYHPQLRQFHYPGSSHASSSSSPSPSSLMSSSKFSFWDRSGSSEEHILFGSSSSESISSRLQEAFPAFKHVPCRKVRVEANHCLYIPAGWWHEVVTTSSLTVAFNIWFSPNKKSSFRSTMLSLRSGEFASFTTRDS